MRTLITTDTIGGVWTYALDLADSLAAAGIDVTLAVLGPSPSPAQRSEAAAVAAVADTGLPLDWLAATADEVRTAGTVIARLADKAHVDVVHLNSPSLAAGGPFRMPVVGTCHSCLASWWNAVRGGPMPADFRWRTDLLQEGLLQCDRVLVPSAAFARDLSLLYRLPAVAVIHNGRRAPATPSVTERQGIVTAGRLWDDGKDVRCIDAAAGRLTVPVVAIGSLDGPDGQRLALEHAIPTGRLEAPALADQLKRAAIFVSAALYEPFGLSVLEAAQAGCALVLSDIATFRELWEGAAHFVRARDPAALAVALDHLGKHPTEMAALGEAARRRAAGYSMGAMGEAVVCVYRGLQAPAVVPVTGAAA